MAQRLRVKLKSYDHRVIDEAVLKILDSAMATGAKIRGPIPLPTKRTLIPDIDVIYLDRNDFTNEEAGKESTKAEIRYENKLRVLMPEINWSVTNQSRMHLFHNDKSYVSSEEAIGQWVETATCVGVRLDKENNVIVAAPRGIDDLVNMILRPTSDFQKELFSKRVNNKGWLKKWPKLRIG